MWKRVIRTTKTQRAQRDIKIFVPFVSLWFSLLLLLKIQTRFFELVNNFLIGILELAAGGKQVEGHFYIALLTGDLACGFQFTLRTPTLFQKIDSSGHTVMVARSSFGCITSVLLFGPGIGKDDCALLQLGDQGDRPAYQVVLLPAGCLY